MPIIWRHLLKHFFKVLLLALSAILLILLVTRMDDIARFAAMASHDFRIFLFTLYQISYIVPIALPIACLISSIVLYQRLSHLRELTALRAAGMSLRKITFPILIAGAFLSLVNFYMVSEVATQTHMKAKLMQHDLVALSPLALLNHPQYFRLQGAYVKVDGVQHSEGTAQHVYFGLYNGTHKRLNLFSITDLKVGDALLQAQRSSLISSLDPHLPDEFDHLMIENQESIASKANLLSLFVKRESWKLSNDHLRLNLLRVRLEQAQKNIHTLEEGTQKKALVKYIAQARSDIVRRISIALAAFTFTLMGTAFGIDIHRRPGKKGVVMVIVLATFALICFFLAKNLSHYYALASTMYLSPHLLIGAFSVIMLKRVTKGIE